MLTSLTTGISDYATRRAIQQLASKLNHDSKPTFAGLTINGESISDALIAQWSTAYSWGDHAGLYDAIGTAEGEVSDHESTYDHSLLHSPVTLDALTGITLTGQQLSYTAGYAIPTTAKQAEWDSAYTHKTTEDAINGLVSCDGSGAYTAKVIGTDVQAYDADLTAIAALTPTDGNIIVGDGSTWVAESGDTARTSLGLGVNDRPTFDGLVLGNTVSVPNPILYVKGYNSHTLAIEQGYLEVHDYTGGDNCNVVLGATNDASTNIRLQTDSVSAHIGLNIGATACSGFTYENSSGNGLIAVRGADGQANTDATEKVTLTMTSTGATLSTGKGGIYLTPYSSVTDLTGSLYVHSETASPNLTFEGDGYTSTLIMDTYVAGSSGTGLAFRKGRGSKASPGAVQSADRVMNIGGAGYSATASEFVTCVAIRGYVDGTPDSAGDTSDMPGRLSFWTVPDGDSTLVERLRIDQAGNVGVNYTAGTHKLSVNGTCAFGDGGTTNYAEFEADGTLKFNGAATVWNDVNVGAMALSLPVASQPDEVNFLDNTGADTGITTWGFAVGEKVSGAIDIPHDYKTGSNFTPHVHFQIIGAPAGGTDKAKWQIVYGKGRTGSTLAPATTITKELDVTTQYGFYRADFDAVDGTNWVLGDQFIFSLSRVAASSDEYAGDLLIATVGLHYECDTVGSRSITTK